MNQPTTCAGPRLSAETVHASTVAIDGRAVLISGPSGSGKSDLALRLIDRGFTLVSDDQTIVSRDGDRLIASAPPEHRRQARDPRHRHRRDGACRATSRSLCSWSSTSDIQRLPDDSRERPILGVDAAAGQHRRDDRLGAVQGRAGARPNGPAVLMAAMRGGPAAPAARHRHVRRGQVDRARRARGYGLGDGRQSARSTCSNGFVHGGGECRIAPAARRHGQPQPRLRPPTAARADPGDRRASMPEMLYLDCAERRADPPLCRDPAAPPARARPPGRRRHRPGARADRAAAKRGRQRPRHHRPHARPSCATSCGGATAAMPTSRC